MFPLPLRDDLARELSLFAKAIEDEIAWGPVVTRGTGSVGADSSIDQFPSFVLIVSQLPSESCLRSLPVEGVDLLTSGTTQEQRGIVWCETKPGEPDPRFAPNVLQACHPL